MADGLNTGQMSVLDAIAHGEVNQPWNGNNRGGYGETVSNQRFNPSDYSATHPYESGSFRYYQGKYGPSSASGRYQETLSTYRDNVRKYGIPGFSTDAQDRRAFAKASDLYQSSGAWKNYSGATGDLTQDVQKFGGDRNWWSSAAAPALRHEWTSIPGGLEPNDKTRNWVSNAVDRFNSQGVGGLPGEQSAGTEYSAEDAPSLLGRPTGPTGPSQQITGVAYNAPPPTNVGATGGVLPPSMASTADTTAAPAAGSGVLGGLLARLAAARRLGGGNSSAAANFTPPPFLQLAAMQQPQPFLPTRPPPQVPLPQVQLPRLRGY
jgi:muramidase (phage lysozyme)